MEDKTLRHVSHQHQRPQRSQLQKGFKPFIRFSNYEMIGDLEKKSSSGVEETGLNCSKTGVNRKASHEYRKL